MVSQGLVFPIFYIQYTNENEIQDKIDMLKDAETYSILFKDGPDGDKKYPYADDFSNFKQMVIECKNSVNEDQLAYIIKTFKPLGMDMLRNDEIGCYVYFVGPQGEDLTKSIINTYRIMNSVQQRNFSNSQTNVKPIPKDMSIPSPCDVGAEDGRGNFLVKNLMPGLDIDNIPLIAGEITMVKEAQENKNIYAKFKIRCLEGVYGSDDFVKNLKSNFKLSIKDSDTFDPISDRDSGNSYKKIILSDPIDASKAKEILKLAKNFGKEVYCDCIGAYVSFYSDESCTKNITKELLADAMKMNMDDLMKGVEDAGKIMKYGRGA